MDIGASGVIFAFVVVLWAAYVLPLALRRYDESEMKLPVGSLGSFSRVIRRAAPEPKEAPRPEIRVDAEAPRGQKITTKAPKAKVAQSLRAKPTDRPSARKAARRRRMVLYALLLPLAVVTILATVALLPTWSIAIPAGLVVAWLVTCRFQVKIERRLTRGAVPARIDADNEATVIINRDDIAPERKHVMERDVALESDALDEQLQIAVPSLSPQGSVQWDPLPVTLPTYVTKPRAGRTVRTIDFDQPGTWTSGHVEGEQTELAEAKKDDGHQEAVGH